LKAFDNRTIVEMPKRNLHRFYMLDANIINAKQENTNVNQLELWHKHKVISLIMSRTAYDEARSGGGVNGDRRREKADNYIWVSTNDSLGGEEEFRSLIENSTFPQGAKEQKDKNDISMLLDAKQSNTTLITSDRCHILRNADRLSSDVGIRVISVKHAVSEIRKCIRRRDKIARHVAAATACKLPQWVGKD